MCTKYVSMYHCVGVCLTHWTSMCVFIHFSIFHLLSFTRVNRWVLRRASPCVALPRKRSSISSLERIFAYSGCLFQASDASPSFGNNCSSACFSKRRIRGCHFSLVVRLGSEIRNAVVGTYDDRFRQAVDGGVHIVGWILVRAAFTVVSL